MFAGKEEESESPASPSPSGAPPLLARKRRAKSGDAGWCPGFHQGGSSGLQEPPTGAKLLRELCIHTRHSQGANTSSLA